VSDRTPRTAAAADLIPAADLAAVVLAAGAGKRLRPLTELRPKPLCPVGPGGQTTLLDLALERVVPLVATGGIAVNAHHLAAQVVEHVGDRAHLSVEQPEALGTAGAVGALRPWIDGRDVIVANGDVCFVPPVELGAFVTEWDRTRPRLLVVDDPGHPDFDGRWRFAGVSLLPAAIAATLEPEPSGLYERVWRDTRIDLVRCDVRYVDCADPPSYLAANLLLSDGDPVICPGATVDGVVERSVVWPGAVVRAGEHLIEVIRARAADGSDLTVPASQGRRAVPPYDRDG
jgi:CTP:molybdopterin cytidylyltransferase MocA